MDTTDLGGAAEYTLFGAEGNGDKQFNAPLGMAFNHDKTEIFVADFLNNRVQVLNYHRGTGGLTFKHTISDKVDGAGNKHDHPLNHPIGVALLGDLIVVADRDNSKVCGFMCVEPFDFLSEYDVYSPCSVAVDKHGSIFAYDSVNFRIAKYNNDDREYICNKGKGTANGQLRESGTLAFDKEGNLVVADEKNNRVQVLNSSNGTHIRTITGISDGRGGQLSGPCGIAFTDDGKNIIIADWGNNQVRVLTYADGKIEKSFGGAKGDKEGEFNGPYGVLVDDENGRIIVSEELNHRIQVIHNALPPKKVEDKSSLVPSTSKYPGLEDAIRNAITAFSTSLGDHEYAAILIQLNEKIDKDRNRLNNPELLLSELLKKVTKPPNVLKRKKVNTAEPKPVSKQMSVDEVTNFISSQKDAIFVVTGGSFNPPHNGHIGMFQKAYEALIKEGKIGDGKKVYGVMVPASDKWIEDKLCKEVTPDTRKVGEEPRNCNKTEFAAKESQAAINSKRIQVAQRVGLCKLSCDSYDWTDSANFNASNMIVVNENGDGEEFTSAKNTYYLCGSDYYKDTSKIKFICVLRKGDVKRDTNLVKKDGKTIPIKDTDIIIEDDGVDNDASSTMLRNILTKINSVVIEGDKLRGEIPSNRDELLKLISIPVLRRLLDLNYILTDPVKSKQILEFMGINLDAPDATSSNDTSIKLKGKAGVKSNGHRSLANMGQTCYMNAALQLIYSMSELKGSTHIPELEAYLSKMDAGVVSDDINLAETLYARAKTGGFVSKRTFNMQEDSSELLVALLGIDAFNKTLVKFTIIDSVHTTTDNTKNKSDCRTQTGVVTHAQYANMPDSIKADIIYIPSISQDLQIFNLPIGTSDSVFNSMNLQKKTVLDEASKINSLKHAPCSNISNTTISTQSVIIPGNTQRYFIVSLNRFSTGDKITKSIELTNAEVTLGNIKFKIKGCISHHGSTKDEGHYTYVSFEGGNPKTVYDDHNIVEYATYNKNIPNRTVDTTGYVLLFEREEIR